MCFLENLSKDHLPHHNCHQHNSDVYRVPCLQIGFRHFFAFFFMVIWCWPPLRTCALVDLLRCLNLSPYGLLFRVCWMGRQLAAQVVCGFMRSIVFDARIYIYIMNDVLSGLCYRLCFWDRVYYWLYFVETDGADEKQDHNAGASADMVVEWVVYTRQHSPITF